MKIIHGIGELRKEYRNPVIAIGVFDGLHHGHKQLIAQAVERAKVVKGTAVVMTFFPHPVHVLRPDIYLPLIVSLPYRLKLIEQLGVDVCIVMRFTKRFAHISPEVFIKRYLVDKIKPKEVIVGDDFRFGQNRAGTLDYFKESGQKYGFYVHAIRAIRGGKKTVSSTHIRQLIAEGKLSKAAHLLERPVSIMGQVVRGDARGQTLGYPTANIDPFNEVLLPAGVFVARVYFDGKAYKGIANIGHRPSFKKSDSINIEVHIFDIKQNLYGKELIIEFLHKIRNERKFDSEKALIKQLTQDEEKARAWFARKRR